MASPDFENNRLEWIGYFGTVVCNRRDKKFYKVILRNEDGTVWAKRLGRMVVLKRERSPTYIAKERMCRWFWSELISIVE